MTPEHTAPLQYLDSQEDRVRQLLPEWTAICSGSDYPEGLNQMRVALLGAYDRLLDRAGVDRTKDVQETDGRISIRCRPDAPFRILFSGHYDTVFGAGHPFQEPKWLTAKTLNAPGCADMKGGLLVMLLTLEAFESYAGKDALGWEMLITPDEEIGSKYSNAALREAARRNHLGMVFEPALPDGGTVRNRKGTGVFEARAKGRAAHTGRAFSDGRNAITALSRFVIELEALNGRYPGAVLNTGKIIGGGALNAVPDSATAYFHIRVNDKATFARIDTQIEKIMSDINQDDGIELTWHGSLTRPPKIVSSREEHFFDVLRESAQHLGLGLDWKDTGGGSDGNILVDAGLPTLDGLGVRGGGLHSPEEFVEIDSVVERARLHAYFLMRLADGSGETSNRA